MKFLKILMILAGVGLVLMAGTVVFIRIKYPPQRIKALVLALVDKNLHRQADVDGVSFGFKGIELTHVKLSERPDFSQGTFVDCESVEVGFSLATLLSRRLMIDKVVLKAPKIRVIRLADHKTFNFSDLTESPAANSSASRGKEVTATDGTSVGKGLVATLMVKEITIKDGTVEFIDRSPAGVQALLAPLNLSVTDFSLSHPFKTKLGVSIEMKQAKNTLSTHVDFSGEMWLPCGIKGTFTAASIQQTNYEGKDLKIVCDLSGSAPDLLLIRGPVEISMGHGEIHSNRLVSTLTALFDPLLSRLVYDSLTAKARFDEGKVEVTEGQLKGSLELNAAGIYSLGSGGLDFHIQLKVSHPSLIPLLVKADKVPLDIDLKGTTENPIYHLKTAQVMNNIAHGLLPGILTHGINLKF